MRKRIGIDARFFTEKATGVGIHVFELVQGLAKLDKENEYTLFLKPEEYDKFQLPGPNFKKESTSAKHYSLNEQWGFYKQLNKYNFDLMIFPQFNVPLLYTKPYVVTIHDLTLHFFPGKKKTDFLSRLAYKLVIHSAVKKAKHCFAVSENTKKDMMKILGVPDEKVTVTYNGVNQTFHPNDDKEALEKFRKKWELSEEYFLYIGVRRSHKNIVGLIKAFDLFLKNNPEAKNHLVFAGPPDDVYSEIPQLIKDLQLEDRVKMLGLFPKEELADLICASNGFVFPSFYEGFGIPPIEAMQCGVPVASSHSSSLPEVCGDAVIYFDPYNIEEIADALEQLSFDEEKRKACIERGFVQSKKFKWDDMVEKMFAVYKQCF